MSNMGTNPRLWGIEMIPNEIVLQIVEYMDTATLGRFMATSKTFYEFINNYECSLSQNHVATFKLPPAGNILSSSSDERCVLQVNTFALVSELELRQKRVDRLISECPKLFSRPSSSSLDSLWDPECLSISRPMIRRALTHCDRIADIAANDPCPSIPPLHYYAIIDGIYELPEGLLSSNVDTEDMSKLNPLTNPTARPLQIEYIRSLSLADIVGLWFTLSAIGDELMNSSVATSPARLERKTIIEECILRHGTWFLWSRTQPDWGLQEMAGYIMAAGRAEIRQWESGALGGRPGLKMTLMQRLTELIHETSDKEGVSNTVLARSDTDSN